MLDNRLKKCCEDCLDICAMVETAESGDCLKNIEVVSKIYCKHEKNCEKYNMGKVVIKDEKGNVLGTPEEMIEKLLNKPPLGTAPSWIAIPRRISDLAGAISRSAESIDMKIDMVRTCAQEILCHCDTMDKLEKQEHGK